MPHMIVEWSDNLENLVDIKALLHLVAEELRNSDGMFPIGGIRVRAYKVGDYVIADGQSDDAFINFTAKIGNGRPVEKKTAFFTALFETISNFLEPIFEKRYLALSMYIEEAGEKDSFKKNNIHERFRKVS